LERAAVGAPAVLVVGGEALDELLQLTDLIGLLLQFLPERGLDLLA
jgi:hypothetical protein